MYFCEKRELNCLKRLILQRIIYIILMDSNNLTPLRKGVVGVQFLFVAFGATDRKSTRLNSSHNNQSRMPSSA